MMICPYIMLVYSTFMMVCSYACLILFHDGMLQCFSCLPCWPVLFHNGWSSHIPCWSAPRPWWPAPIPCWPLPVPYWLSWTVLVATWLVWSYTMLVCCCILLTITNLCSEQSSCGPEYGGNLAGLHLHHSCTTNPHRQEAIGSRSLFQQIKNSFFYCGSVFSRITK